MRFQNISKKEILRRCWSSIQSSVLESDIITIVYDEVSEDTLIWLENTSKSNNITFIEVPKHEWDYHLHTITMLDILTEQIKKFPEELHYIVEDDYLHTVDAIRVLENNLNKWQHFAVSYDYPDRYSMNPRPAMVVLGYDRHWRTVESSTFTILAKGSTWLRHIDHIKTIASTSNDAIFTEIYKIEPCISPLPGVSSHMTDYHLTPLVDWLSLWSTQNV